MDTDIYKLTLKISKKSTFDLEIFKLDLKIEKYMYENLMCGSQLNN